MASTIINFSGQGLRQNLCFHGRGGLAFNVMPMKRSYQLTQNQIKKIQQCRQEKTRPFVERNRYLVVSVSKELEIESSPFSASDMIREFFKCINEKNLTQLDNYISDDCYIEDCSFPAPFQGKKVTS